MKKLIYIIALAFVFSCTEEEPKVKIEDETEIANPLIGSWQAVSFNEIALDEYVPQLNSIVSNCGFYTRDISINTSAAQISENIINLQINSTEVSYFVYASNEGVVDCARGRNGPEERAINFDIKDVTYEYRGISDPYKVQIGYIGSENWLADLKIESTTEFTLEYELEGSILKILYQKQ